MSEETVWLPLLLDRLGLDELPPPSRPGLTELVRAFHQAIPFENLDVLAHVPVSTHLDHIIEKIVLRGRGGWCYELNQLLGEALRSAGFSVVQRMARVGYRRPSLGPLTHLVLVVDVAGQDWLVDVGFGGPGPGEPLLIGDGEQRCGNGSRFLTRLGVDGTVQVQRNIAREWALLYEIQPANVLPIDLEMACHFVATWPNSPFRRQLMCVAHHAASSWTIEDGNLVQLDTGWMPVAGERIRDATHLRHILHEVFGTQAPTELVEESWHRIAATK